tara:strand:+ start:97 stop:270 length:174 start_codon:yes stop_codon:yes gene_type:complete
MVARQKSIRRTTKGKGSNDRPKKSGANMTGKGDPVRVFIAKGCGKVMNNRRKKTKEF